MNKKELIRRITDLIHEKNIRKPVSCPKQVFHISDDYGSTKDFTIKQTDKKVMYTVEDVEVVIDAAILAIENALKRGEDITVFGFGTLKLNYRKARKTKRFGSDEEVSVKARYVPKFTFGNNLRMCAKVYEMSLKDRNKLPLPIYDEDEDSGNDYGDNDGIDCEDCGGGN